MAVTCHLDADAFDLLARQQRRFTDLQTAVILPRQRLVTRDGDLWIATTSGLFRLPGAVPGIAERVAVPGSPDDTRYISLLVVDDQLWAASGAGLAVLDRTSDHGSWRKAADLSADS